MLKRVRIAAVAGAIVLGSLGVPAAAQAAAPVHPLYAAGVSTAGKPVWDTATQKWKWTCSWSSWIFGVTKNFTCKLRFGTGGQQTISSIPGSFTDTYKTLPTYYTGKEPNISLCTVASATYSDGTGYDSDTKCN